MNSEVEFESLFWLCSSLIGDVFSHCEHCTETRIDFFRQTKGQSLEALAVINELISVLKELR